MSRIQENLLAKIGSDHFVGSGTFFNSLPLGDCALKQGNVPRE